MAEAPANTQNSNVAPFVLMEHHLDWEAQPQLLTTRQVAELLGKSTGNVRARASKGDFGSTQSGEDGLPRYDRERVRLVYERMTARQAKSRNGLHDVSLQQQETALPPSLSALLAILQAQQREQSSLWQARVEDAQQYAQRAREEAKELRKLLREREETTRATLSHMDLLHDQNIQQSKQTLAQERMRWQAEVAAKDTEIEQLKSEMATEKNRPQPSRKLFGPREP